MITIEKFANRFEILCDTEYNSVVFGLTKAITPAQAQAGTWGAMTGAERTVLNGQGYFPVERRKKRIFVEVAKNSYDLNAA